MRSKKQISFVKTVIERGSLSPDLSSVLISSSPTKMHCNQYTSSITRLQGTYYVIIDMSLGTGSVYCLDLETHTGMKS
jgi:hypothetical protein